MVNPDPATRVSYDLAQVLKEIQDKIDKIDTAVEALHLEWTRDHNRLEERISVIEARPAPIANGSLRVERLEEEVKDLRTRVQLIENTEYRRIGMSNLTKAAILGLGALIAAGQLVTTVILAI